MRVATAREAIATPLILSPNTHIASSWPFEGVQQSNSVQLGVQTLHPCLSKLCHQLHGCSNVCINQAVLVLLCCALHDVQP